MSCSRPAATEPPRRWGRRLPVAHREIILLCDVDEMSYREIAQVLDVPVGTVMSRLARARASLRRELGAAKEAVR